MHGLIAAFLILSGIAALAYQIVWVRLLGYVVGGTSASVSTVLAAFFLGLALGNAVTPVLLRRLRPLRLYVVLECVIGIAGITSLFVLPGLGTLLGPTLGSSLLAKFLASSVLLLIPTLCMGATFPVLATVAVGGATRLSATRSAPADGSIFAASSGNGAALTTDVGARLGRLYALNTLGAVLGAAMAGFWWIPSWGLDGTVVLAAGLNLLVATLALLSTSHLESRSAPMSVQPAPPESAGVSPFRRLALAALALTGFVSIATEVGWSRYLAVFTGSTVYGFAMILIAVLVGITVGSWVMHRFLRHIVRPAQVLVVGIVLLSLALLLTRTLLSLLPGMLETVQAAALSGSQRFGIKFAAVFAVLLLPTVLFGALFPLSLSLYCGSRHGVRRHLGPAYAVNTVFSVLGSVAAGFWIIPAFGTNVLLTALALTGIVFALLLLPSTGASPRRRVIVVTLAIAGVLTAWKAPGLRYEELIASVHYAYDRDARGRGAPRFLFLHEGKAGVVSLATWDGRYVRVQNNGLKESLLDLENPGIGPAAETLLGALPVLLHSEPQSCFVVGWGGGTTVRALERTTIDSIRVVELEPAIVEATRTLLGKAAGLDDPRLVLSIDDARFRLQSEAYRYDIIVSQPSHPWVAGAGAVFTSEFFELVRARLRPGGIAGQWINLFNMDVETLCSLHHTFFRVFPHGFTLMDLQNGDLLLFGSDAALRLDPDVLQTRWDRLDPSLLRDCCGIEQPLDLLQHFAWSRRQSLEHCGSSRLNTDLNLLSEMHLASMSFERRWRRGAAEDPYAVLGQLATFDLAPTVSVDVDSLRWRIGVRAVVGGDRATAQRVRTSLENVAAALADSLDHLLARPSRVPVPPTTP